MVPLRLVAELGVSAASAIVVREPWLFIAADDETALDVVRLTDGVRVRRIPLMDRPLPADPRTRKAAKPDFEAMAWLPEGELLVLGSGSTPARTTAVIVDRWGEGVPRPVDFAPVIDAVRARIGEVNFEGAAAAGPLLRLLSRGDGGRKSFVVDLDLKETAYALSNGRCSSALVVECSEVTIGELVGVPLSFTDAAPVSPSSTRLLFTAAAEDTANAYDDGPCAGSVMGLLGEDGGVEHLEAIDAPVKVEGIARSSCGAKLYLVADADDPTRRAPLFEADVPDWLR
jgi:hypothetical protein